MSLDLRVRTALRTLGLPEQSPAPIGEGKFNAIFKVLNGSESFALRINNIHNDPAVDDRDCEHAAHQWAASNGVAPRIFEWNADFMLMEYLPIRAPGITDIRERSRLEQIVHAAKIVHQGPRPSPTKSLWTRSQYWMERRRNEGNATSELEAAWTTMERLEWREAVESYQQLVLGHGDLNPGNIGLLPDRSVLIDFETAALMSPFFDLSRLCYFADSPAVEQLVLECYFGAALPEHQEQLRISIGLQSFVAAVFGSVSTTQGYQVNAEALARFWSYAR